MIDFSHHRGHARQALDETVAFSDAVERALEITDPLETLIVVTSDHSHSMVFAGYPDRGSSVLCKEFHSLNSSQPITEIVIGNILKTLRHDFSSYSSFRYTGRLCTAIQLYVITKLSANVIIIFNLFSLIVCFNSSTFKFSPNIKP